MGMGGFNRDATGIQPPVAVRESKPVLLMRACDNLSLSISLLEDFVGELKGQPTDHGKTDEAKRAMTFCQAYEETTPRLLEMADRVRSIADILRSMLL